MRDSGPGAMGEEAVEGIDGRAHERDLALAPALVGAQHAQCPGVLARRHRLEHQLRQCRGIQQPEIHTLPGQRVHDVRRIPEERHALGDIAGRARDAAGGRRGARSRAAWRRARRRRPASSACRELLGCGGEQLRARASSADHTIELVPSASGRKRERAVAHEALPCGVLVRLLGGHGGDDRGLPVVSASAAQADGRAHRRVRPVRAHHQPRRQLARARCPAHARVCHRNAVTRGAARDARRRRQRPQAARACSRRFSTM